MNRHRRRASPRLAFTTMITSVSATLTAPVHARSKIVKTFAVSVIAAQAVMVGMAGPANADTPGYINRAAPHAQAERAEFDVPASVSIAQSILESRSGDSTQGREDNNFHGLKCAAPDRPGPIAIRCRAYTTQECTPSCHPVTAWFRVFASMLDSFRDHGRLLTQSPAYAHALPFRHDPDRFIREIARTYATDPVYADKVIRLMRDHNLYRFDTQAPPPEEPAATVRVARHVPDVDGDGRPDVLGVAAVSGDALWVTLNSSVPGSPSRGGTFHLSNGWGTVHTHMMADWDTDGRVDIVARHEDNLAVWLNTSTPGRPSFAASGIVLGSGWGTLDKLMAMDLTGDGKVDIVGWNSGGAAARHDQLFVIPNTSTPGLPSRGNSIRISEGWRTVRTFMAVDYDGDGKVDILGRAGDYLTVWRNTSINGQPSHSGPINLGTGWNAIGTLMLMDVTGDGKPDIAGYGRIGGNEMWVTPNTSTPGNPSRGNSYFVSNGWHTVHTYMIGDWDVDGKTDIIARHADNLAVWRNTSSNGQTIITAPGTVLGTGWGAISPFLTKHQP